MEHIVFNLLVCCKYLSRFLYHIFCAPFSFQVYPLMAPIKATRKLEHHALKSKQICHVKSADNAVKPVYSGHLRFPKKVPYNQLSAI